MIAQPLSYLKLSIQEKIPFTTSLGEKGYVINPEAWIFHKGLTFKKRITKIKTYKDLYGIWYVGTQLGDWSIQSIDRLERLFVKYPKWHQRFKMNIKGWINEASPFDWATLESQDPFGKLKKGNFLLLFDKMLSQ